MNLIKTLTIASTFFFTTSALYSSWQVDDFLSILEQTEPNPQKDMDFAKLKEKVKEQLQQSWCSPEKIDLLMDLIYIIQPRVCVEIGAFTGSSVLPVATALQHLGRGKIYAIDAWSNEEAVRYLAPNDPNRNWWSTVDMNAVRCSFDQLMNAWSLNDVCTPISKPSSLALPLIPEIDFLHLDGDFSEEGSLYDVKHYLEKVKPGGYVLLSNVYHTVNNKQPKLKTLSYLLETCEYTSDVDSDNTVLFRKR
jgi:hypothetical protein